MVEMYLDLASLMYVGGKKAPSPPDPGNDPTNPRFY
jgi:hypothetical protein